MLWSLRDAPNTGLRLAQDAAQQMKQGQHLSDNPVEDAMLNLALTTECYDQSRFALECAIRYLHAGGDLVAQIVNATLPVGIEESHCTLNRLVTSLNGEERRTDLVATLTALRDSAEFQYVQDAANRMKHRNLLYGGIGARRNDEGCVDVRQHLGAFDYGDRQHSRVQPNDIGQKGETLRLLAGKVLEELIVAVTAP